MIAKLKSIAEDIKMNPVRPPQKHGDHLHFCILPSCFGFKLCADFWVNRGEVYAFSDLEDTTKPENDSNTIFRFSLSEIPDEFLEMFAEKTANGHTPRVARDCQKIAEWVMAKYPIAKEANRIYGVKIKQE